MKPKSSIGPHWLWPPLPFSSASGETPTPFKVAAYTGKADRAHIISFVKEANEWFPTAG